MNRRALLVLWVALIGVAHVLPAWIAPMLDADPPAQSARQVAYDFDAHLDAKTRVVAGQGTITWKNPSPVPVKDVWIHLYLNAFRDKNSAFMQESNASHRGHSFDPRRPGGIELTSFRRKDGPQLRTDATFEPPEGYALDRTVLRVPLDVPIAPGASTTFELTWTSTLPRVFARTGAGLGADFFMVAQWYPKFGVFEPTGDGEAWGWNCHAFHGNSEFYADYGVFDVRLRVPERFAEKIGATGKRQGDPKPGEDGTLTYTFHAEDVHDFSWVVGEDFFVHTEQFEGGAGTDPEEQARVAGILGRAPSDLDLPPVEITFLLQPEHKHQLERHIRAVKSALTLMGFWFGPYPYPTLTVVDPDHRGRDAGGMEYPTLITGGTRYVRAARQLSPEGVLVHEFGHQHFYGLVGSNEFENAWMDEGFTTYATGRVLMHAFPPSERVTWYAGRPMYGERALPFTNLRQASRTSVPALTALFDETWRVPFGSFGPMRSLAAAFGVHHPPDDLSLLPSGDEVSPLAFLREVPTLSRWRARPASVGENERTRDAASPVVDPIAGRKAWEYMDRRSYGANSYRRTANALRTLEQIVGESTMLRILRTYAERFRFQHPKPEDFFATANEVAGRDLQWFFDDVFVKGRTVDYGIESIDNFDVPVVTVDDKPNKDEPKLHRAEVVVRRFGEARLPVEVRVRFDDDTERHFVWERDDTLRALDGQPAPVAVIPTRATQARWTKVRFVGPRKIELADVDPNRWIGMDRNRANDGRRTTPHRGASWNLALRLLGQVEMTTSFYGGI